MSQSPEPAGLGRRALSRRASARRLAAVAASCCVLAASASACASAQQPGATDAGTQIQVVAAETVWGDIAKQIGGDEVQITSILGVDGKGGVAGTAEQAAAFQPTAADSKALQAAQLVILNGAGLDPWVSQTLSSNAGINRLEVNVANQVGVTPGQNPYLWYDPAYVQTAARQIEQDFVQLRPNKQAYFQQQETEFEANAVTADEQTLSGLKQKYSGMVVATCDQVGAELAAQLGLKAVQPKSAALLAQSGGRILLCDAEDPGATSQAILKQAGVDQIPVVALSAYPEPAGTSYQEWQASQLQSVSQALAQG
ncbi:metal ABC transporter solute-binding protein, Zn/Mn family [Actinospica robiniae]|uniref:metal ABC transporter solute-binding protein, Zn/Mn family n=1 Tax=Actinospica robiniae TaxID=304901 RepID=UPI00041D68F4|nr:zinc ABC transporter substrate-binding protein [Actinospica robiniae]